MCGVADGPRLELVRDLYLAFAAGDRDVVERTFSGDLSFSSPLDVDLDRAGYFERCWPGAGAGQRFDFVRMIESGDEVVVTYEMKRSDGRRGRNTEVLTFERDTIRKVEVYFGWDLDGLP
jgi:hypothetical protein